MYFTFLPFLLSLLPFSMMEIQEGIPEIRPVHMNSVLQKCGLILHSTGLNFIQKIEILPLNTVCHPNIQKYFDCVLENVYKSNAIIDIHLRSLTDFYKAKAATKSLCQKAHEFKNETLFCNASVEKCKSDFRPSVSTINKDSPLFCQMVADRRCEFNEFAKCDLKMAMLWAKYQEEAQSIGCLVSDPMIQLVPTYGPELKCYSAINISDIKHTDYSQIYERYCDQFNYSEVSSCVEKTLSNVTSEELWEDKESYINKARKFVNDRQMLCRNLMALPIRKCIDPDYKPDVSLCQNMLFMPPGPSKHGVSLYVTFYAYCVWLAYFPCNVKLGHFIYSNLMK